MVPHMWTLEPVLSPRAFSIATAHQRVGISVSGFKQVRHLEPGSFLILTFGFLLLHCRCLVRAADAAVSQSCDTEYKLEDSKEETTA